MRASERETEEGSARSCCAVRRASCFCCRDVPPVGAVGGGEEAVESLAKREEREGCGLVEGGGEGGCSPLHGLVGCPGDAVVGEWVCCPVPKAGMDMPALPSLPSAL